MNLARSFYFEPGSVHRRQDQQGQDGGDEEATGNGDGQGAPEDAAHEGNHAQNGRSGREHDGPEAHDR